MYNCTAIDRLFSKVQITVKALLHGEIFHATCLAMMICAALNLQGEGVLHAGTRLHVFFSIKAFLREHWMTRMRPHSLLWKHCEATC